jgi:hypothetical protein
VATKDRTVQPELQRFVAKLMDATSYDAESSHVPMLSNSAPRNSCNPHCCRVNCEATTSTGASGTDSHSRAIAGYYLSFEPPTAAQTALAPRQAIWRKQDPRWQVCGIPDVLYTDNGRDFTSRHTEQVCADLKIQLILSTPGTARGRGRIERFFETVNQMFLCELPGYAPVGSGVRGKPSLTMPELDSLLSNFLLDVYHRRQHAETNLTPGERWKRGGFLPRMPDSLEQIDLLLLAVAGTCEIHPDGIRFDFRPSSAVVSPATPVFRPLLLKPRHPGLRYVDLTLAAYVGETVTLRFDPRDMAEVRVFHPEKFLCRAICAELAGTTIPLREIFEHEIGVVASCRLFSAIAKKLSTSWPSVKAPQTLRSSFSTPWHTQKQTVNGLKVSKRS